MNNTGLLLDTHVWIWFVNGEPSLSPSTKKTINAAIGNGTLFLSPISIWEVAMLEAKNRLILTKPCQDWIASALDLSGIKLVPLSVAIMIEGCKLPGEFHGDPADAMLVATARVETLTLMTRDTRILQYSKKHYLKALKA